ncbi:dynamin family protein [Desulfobotulus sp. H1]|uniref:Dynamin family protein n=1 Tax=Desulfobotulus pelophilus TaxID=2823377 RepID=A0ABT3NC32_9BACT|nr:dynamin family protein [Desulfobotulus pelophilus]MCW7755030.1 dynamin family protein [Desulfobotulus pelophilus]
MHQASLSLPSQDKVWAFSALLVKAADQISGMGSGFLHYGENLSHLNQRLCEGRFHLAVLGQFKRGKSTLLNALAGEAILPMGVLPLTAAPTFIQFGEAPRISVCHGAGKNQESFMGKSTAERSAWLAHFVTEKENPENRREVSEVLVDLPAPILSSGLVLIDTPGIGSTHLHNTTATFNFLESCDAALFLISADPPMTAVELAFLREVQKKVPQLIFVLNKIDYLAKDELEEALGFYRGILMRELGLSEDVVVFCVSARRGLEARQAEDQETWAACGMADLERFLGDFLARKKMAALMNAVALRGRAVLDAVLMEARIALKAFRLPQEVLEEKRAFFAKSLEKAEEEGHLIQDILAGDKKRILAFVEKAAEEMHQESMDFLSGIMGREAKGGKGLFSSKLVEKAWAEAIPDFFAEQQAVFQKKVTEYLVRCFAGHEARLEGLIETLRHAAADLFQETYCAAGQDGVDIMKKKPYWVTNTWNTDSLPVLKSTGQRMDELARRNAGNIRWAMVQNVNNAFIGFSARVRQRLADTVTNIQGAMEAAQVRLRTRDGSLEDDVQRMEKNLAVLESLRRGMGGF